MQSLLGCRGSGRRSRAKGVAADLPVAIRRPLKISEALHHRGIAPAHRSEILSQQHPFAAAGSEVLLLHPVLARGEAGLDQTVINLYYALFTRSTQRK